MKELGRQARSLVHLLQLRAEEQGEQIAKIFLPPRGGQPDRRSYAQLEAEARALAVHVLEVSRPGDRALLLFPPGLDFTVAFFGCLYAGVVAVPAPPPDPRRLQRTLPRLSSILGDCDPSLILTVSQIGLALDAAVEEEPRLGKLPRLDVDRADMGAASLWTPPPQIGPRTLAYLQYTSGSTAAPKGVMSQHCHLLENSRYLQEGFRHSSDSVFLSWVPDFHDDGLLQGVVGSLYTGFPCIRMSPMAVVGQPLAWLQAIHEYRVTHSGGPNFIYELTRRRVLPKECEGLDLSSWRVAYNAAEPIRSETLRGFADAFASTGFRFDSFYPSFGMAETTLLIATKTFGTKPILLTVHGASMEREGRIVPTLEEAGSRTVVGCGKPVGQARFEIVDPETSLPVAPGSVGELWITDPCVAAGYWGREEATRETFQAYLAGTQEGPFLRTGDLAFLHDEELFISGRLKDMIVLRGRNLYPQDVELAAEQSHAALRPGCGAAFGVDEEGEERTIVVQEVQKGFLVAEAKEVVESVRQAVGEALDAEVSTVVLIQAGSVPKTSSGKIQRSACRRAYLDDALEVVFESRRGRRQGVGEARASALEVRSRQDVSRWMAQRLASAVGLEPQEIDHRWPFSRFGLGSAATVGLTVELEGWLGRSLPETLLYEHPDIESLSQALAEGSQQPMVEQDSKDAAGVDASADPAPDEAMAVIGMACRFPGAESPEEFWRLLTNGLDAIREVPSSRWDIEAYFDPDPQAPGKMNTRWGGFLDQVDRFDPYFFGISPREAERMDPQQRVLLELAWEVLEDGGVPSDALAGSPTGVFVGIGMSDYGRWMLEDSTLSDAYAGTGSALSIAANRISYALDLRGPSLAVDTACSSSLVALLQACQSLRRGDCELALAGGANLLLAPEVTVNFSKAGFMAPDGRCKAFDARGDGYVRSEGAGLVLLKPLSAAMRDGNTVYAVIRGGATNQDGRSNGLTAPNPGAQEDMLRKALKDAGVAPGDIDTVEAHGTGTALGDPIEAQALGRVLGSGRSAESPCRLGSVKTNIGHLETAAGIAGVLKTALSLFHGERVPSLHFESPNPRIAFGDLGLTVQTRREPWPRDRRLAGISSFGFGGTNAHLILEGPPPSMAGTGIRQDLAPHDASPVLIPLSAHSEAALVQRTRDLADWIERSPEVDLKDLAATLAHHRSHLDHRWAVVASDRSQLVSDLRSRALKGQNSGSGRRGGGLPRVAFVFPGQGSQWPGMGLGLYRQEPAFRQRFEEASEALAEFIDWSPLEVLAASEELSRLEEINVVQPLTFLLQVSLAALWESWGVKADAVVGHSLGEVAAACVAGALSLRDGGRIICLRSSLMRRVAGQGGMLVVDLPQDELNDLLKPYRGRAEVAVVNSPTAAAVSGDREALDSLHRGLTDRGVFCRFVKVDVAAHGPQMEPLVEELGLGLRDVQPRESRIPMISTVTGGAVSGTELGAAYWQRNLRSPVRFFDAASHLLGEGFDTFLELSGHPLLRAPLEQVAESHGGGRVACLGSLRRKEPELASLLATLASIYEGHGSIQWKAVVPKTGKRLSLPLYPWQRERFWLKRPQRSTDVMTDGPAIGHPLLGRRFVSARHKEVAWQTRLTPGAAPFLQDHRVNGSLVLPGTAFVEMALVAASASIDSPKCALTGMELERAVFVSEADLLMGRGPYLQTSIFTEPTGQRRFEIHSREGGGEWVRHVRGNLLDCPSGVDSSNALDLDETRQRLKTRTDGADLYRTLASAGYSYGPRHRGLHFLWSDDREALGELKIPPEAQADTGLYQLHPSILDAAWQTIAVLLPDFHGTPWIPIGIERHRVEAHEEPVAWAHAQLRPSPAVPEAIILADVALYSTSGKLVAETLGLALRRLGSGAQTSPAVQDWLYDVSWRPVPHGGSRLDGSPSTWLLLPDRGGVAADLARQLEERGQTVVSAPVELGEGDVEAADLRRWLRDAWSPGALPIRGIVYGWALDLVTDDLGRGVENGQPTKEARRRACHVPADLVREVILGSGDSPPRMWFLTRNALPVASVDPAGSVGSQAVARGLGLSQSPLCGLARVVFSEHRDLQGGLLDLDPADSVEASARLVASELLNPGGEPEIAFRGARRHVPRLRRRTLGRSGAKAPQVPAIRGDATYLVTGGSGGLGLACARWLAKQGAKSLVLVSRRRAPEAAVDELEGLGARVAVETADVGDAQALREVFASLESPHAPPLAGILHAAGVVDDGVLLEQDRQRFEAVLRPKWTGAWNLHRCCEGHDLDFFVLFSSAASVLGNPGQGPYCAANAFLDALAQHRRRLGLPGVSVNWGLWRDLGFAASGPKGEMARRRLASQGFETIPPESGLEALGLALAGKDPQVVVLPADWQKVQSSGSPLALAPLLSELLAEQTEKESGGEDTESPEVSLSWEALEGARPEERSNLLEGFLRHRLAAILRMPPDRLPRDEPLTALGLDSLVAVELRNAVEGGLGHPIPLSWLLQGASLEELTSRVLEQLATDKAEGKGEPLAADEAERLLGRVDELPAEEVDRLLALMAAESGVPS